MCSELPQLFAERLHIAVKILVRKYLTIVPIIQFILSPLTKVDILYLEVYI